MHPLKRPNVVDRGLSLLEVVLALAILGVSAAFLTQAMQLATQNALKSQNLSQAEVVAESVVSQIVAGVLTTQPVSWTPYGVSTLSTTWQYSIYPLTAEVQGMLGFQVAVRDASRGTESEQPDLLVTRWIIDPSLGLDVPPTTETTDSSTSSSSSTGTGQQASSGGGQTGGTQTGAVTGGSMGGYGGMSGGGGQGGGAGGKGGGAGGKGGGAGGKGGDAGGKGGGPGGNGGGGPGGKGGGPGGQRGGPGGQSGPRGGPGAGGAPGPQGGGPGGNQGGRGAGGGRGNR